MRESTKARIVVAIVIVVVVVIVAVVIVVIVATFQLSPPTSFSNRIPSC